MRKTLIASAIASVIAIGAVFTFVGVRSNDLEALTRSNCEAINESNKATADVFRLLETAASENPNQTEAQKVRAAKFFAAVYRRLEPRDC